MKDETKMTSILISLNFFDIQDTCAFEILSSKCIVFGRFLRLESPKRVHVLLNKVSFPDRNITEVISAEKLMRQGVKQKKET